MRLKRLPRPALRPFVETLWVTDETSQLPSVTPRREHVLPTGMMHLVFRLADNPLRLFEDTADTAGEFVGDAVVGGARASFYIRDISRPLCSVGAQLRPGAAQALFGVPVDELAGRHTRVEDLWGPSVASMREQPAECPPAQRLDVFEAMLADRLPAVRGVHPAVARALEQFSSTSNVHDGLPPAGTVTGRLSRCFCAQSDSRRNCSAACCGSAAHSSACRRTTCPGSTSPAPPATAIKRTSTVSFGNSPA